MVDAEDHYKEMIIKMSKKIRELKEERLKSNCGYGFVSFSSNLQVKRIKNEFKELVKERLPEDFINREEIKKWKVKKAPVASDILWENMMNDESISTIKSWILAIILFIMCAVIITPTFLIDNLKKIIESFQKVEDGSMLSFVFQTFISPLLVLTFNSGLLPLFIDFIAFLEGYKSKSQR